MPLIRTAELEGHVVIANGDEKQPVTRALVWLKTLDGEVVAQTSTAFDGFFLFDGIEPGVYEVSLDEPLTKRLLYRPDKVTVLSGNVVIKGVDFTLRAAQAKSIQLDRIEQEEVSQ